MRPALRALQGHAQIDRPRLAVHAAEDIESRAGRTDFVRAVARARRRRLARAAGRGPGLGTPHAAVARARAPDRPRGDLEARGRRSRRRLAAALAGTHGMTERDAPLRSGARRRSGSRERAGRAPRHAASPLPTRGPAHVPSEALAVAVAAALRDRVGQLPADRHRLLATPARRQGDRGSSTPSPPGSSGPGRSTARPTSTPRGGSAR